MTEVEMIPFDRLSTTTIMDTMGNKFYPHRKQMRDEGLYSFARGLKHPHDSEARTSRVVEAHRRHEMGAFFFEKPPTATELHTCSHLNRTFAIGTIIPGLELREPSSPMTGLLPGALRKLLERAHLPVQQTTLRPEDSLNVALFVPKTTQTSLGLAALNLLIEKVTEFDPNNERVVWSLVPESGTKQVCFEEAGFVPVETARYDEREGIKGVLGKMALMVRETERSLPAAS